MVTINSSAAVRLGPGLSELMAREYGTGSTLRADLLAEMETICAAFVRLQANAEGLESLSDEWTEGDWLSSDIARVKAELDFVVSSWRKR